MLAGCLGVRRLYGFMPDARQPVGEKEQHQLLFKMSAKGFLETAADGFLVTVDIRELFDCLKQAENVIIVSAADESFPAKCIYPGDKILLVETGGIQGKYFKCACGLHPEIWEDICEGGVLLEQNIADDLLYDAEPMKIADLGDDGLEQLAAFWTEGREIDNKKLQEYGVHAVWEMRNIQDTSIGKRMLLIQRPLYDAIFVQEAEKTRIFHYSKRLVMEIWEEWMEEEQNDNGRCLCTGVRQGV